MDHGFSAASPAANDEARPEDRHDGMPAIEEMKSRGRRPRPRLRLQRRRHRVDLDGCRNPAIREELERASSSPEISPSGTGVKIIGRTRTPIAFRQKRREIQGKAAEHGKA